MKYFKSVLTVEASIISLIIIYVSLFFIDASMYFYDKNNLHNNLISSGLRIQNYYECSEQENKNIITKKDNSKIKNYLNDSVSYGYTFSKFLTSNSSIGISDIKLRGKIKYIGMVIPFKNIEIEDEVIMGLMTPAMDLRINKEIKNFRNE